MQKVLVAIVSGIIIILSTVATTIGQTNETKTYFGTVEIDGVRYYFVISEEYEANALAHRVILDPDISPNTEMSGVRHSDGEWGELKFCAPHRLLDFDVGCVISGFTRIVWSGNTKIYRDLEPRSREFMIQRLEKAFEYGINERYRVGQQR